jgi:hypothetical protein
MCKCKCKKTHLHTSCVSVNVKKKLCNCKSFTLTKIIHAIYMAIFTYKHNTGWAISCLLGVVCRVMAKEAGLLGA